MILNPKTLEKLRNIINEESQYRSGPQLIAFFNQLGFKDAYGQGFPSRSKFTDDKLNQINGRPELDACLRNIFSPINYIGNIAKLDQHINDFNNYLTFDKWQIIRSKAEIQFKKLDQVIIQEENISKTERDLSEDDFLHQEFQNVSLDALLLDSALTEVLKLRFEEIKICLKNDAPLSAIFLIGSSLEGVLLGMATSYPRKFNQANSSPKEKDSTVKPFHLWTLSNFIDVSYEVGLLKQDVHKFSHALRDFRNYIHPYQQMSSRFNPDKHTAAICWQVLRVAISQLSNRKIDP